MREKEREKERKRKGFRHKETDLAEALNERASALFLFLSLSFSLSFSFLFPSFSLTHTHSLKTETCTPTRWSDCSGKVPSFFLSFLPYQVLLVPCSSRSSVPHKEKGERKRRERKKERGISSIRNQGSKRRREKVLPLISRFAVLKGGFLSLSFVAK